MAVIKDEAVKDLVESDVDDNFDLKIDAIAKKVAGESVESRFSEWLDNDEGKIKDVLKIVKDEGVSPAFFAAYELSEGYNPDWGWLNHTDAKGNPEEDAKSVADWVVEQSKDTSTDPAWVDQGNPVDFVPDDVKEEGNKHFEGLPSGTIGRVLIAGTAAATWEVYYPKGLKEEYNEVQDYDKPITRIADYISDWGGSITGGGGGGKVLFIFPLEDHEVSQKYKVGEEYDPEHFGVDLISEKTDVLATADGTVSRSYESDSYGQVVFIKHKENGKKWESVYAHMKDGSREVEEGDKVKQGDKLGVMGDTGDSQGAHTHFELHQPSWNAEKSNSVDPLDYLGEKIGDEEPEEPEEKDDLIPLLLSGALNGW